MELLKASLIATGEMPREEIESRITPSLLQDLSTLPSRDIAIVGASGRVLEVGPGPLRPLSSLPYPKEVIRRSLETLLSGATDITVKRDLEAGLLALDDFIPDKEIPEDREAHAKEWFRRLSLRGQQRRGLQQ